MLLQMVNTNVLCSITELRSSTAVEQLLGRVLRLPYAKRKQTQELNRAYAFSTSASFIEAANALKDALVDCGFNRQEVNDLIATRPTDRADVPPMIGLWQPTVSAMLTEVPDLSQLETSTASRITIDLEARTFTFAGPMSEADRLALAAQLGNPADRAILERVYRQSRGFSVTVPPVGLSDEPRTPAERGVTFPVPVLAIQQGELLEQFAETHFREEPWGLANADATMSEVNFSSRRLGGQVGAVDINEQGRITISFLEELRARQTVLAQDRWTVGELLFWLQRNIPHIDLESEDVGRFLQRMLRHLLDTRRLDLDFLIHNKIQLRNAAAAKIDEFRRSVHRASYDSLFLPGCATPLVVRPEVCFSYQPNAYPYNFLYRGGFQFTRHFYPQVGDLKSEGEEFECACFLDMLPEVEFWVRNIERKPAHSFWLQTSTDRFYPDFVCKLRDGRVLVVEYKGIDRWDNPEEREKRDLGELWEARSNSLCLFRMPRGKDFESLRRAVLPV